MSDWAKLTYEEKHAKARRAAEVLSECGWLFDEAVAQWTDAIVNSPASAADKREEAYRYIRATQGLRPLLEDVINKLKLEDAQRAVHAKRSGPLEE